MVNQRGVLFGWAFPKPWFRQGSAHPRAIVCANAKSSPKLRALTISISFKDIGKMGQFALVDKIVDSRSVCVIIAAHNAARTIAASVRSVLAETEVGEVTVVDDASSDGTADVAIKAADGDPRLRVIRMEQNVGPAAARNCAIEASTSAWVAVLDADDVVLPGRFRTLVQSPCDIIADNIRFVFEDAHGDLPLSDGPVQPRPAAAMTLGAFVHGNMSTGTQRDELGFLKPLMRRDFLTQHGLSYDPRLRLGEDFDLYARALLAGARFEVTPQVGYIARIRADSLSANHKTADLKALLEACDRHVVAAPASDRAILQQHRRQCLHRYLLRACLDAKAASGMWAALRFALSPPSHLPPIARGVLRDKLAAQRPADAGQPDGRTLLPL